jgi:hypothetical protein
MIYVGHGVYPSKCWNLEANSSPNLYTIGKAGMVVIGEIITHVLTTSSKEEGAHVKKKSPNQTCIERKMKKKC